MVFEITNKFNARPWTLHTFKIMLKSHILEYEINLTKRPRHLENTGGFGWHDTTKFAVSKRKNGLVVFVHFQSLLLSWITETGSFIQYVKIHY